MVDLRDAVAARNALGRQLAQLRLAAGRTQHQLAELLVCYGRSTVANVETGRQRIGRDFWARCDEALKTGGVLVEGFEQVDAVERASRRDLAEAARITREAAALRASATDGRPGTAGDIGAVEFGWAEALVNDQPDPGCESSGSAQPSSDSITVSVMVGRKLYRLRLSRRALLQAGSNVMAAGLAEEPSQVPQVIDPGIVDHFTELRDLLVKTDNRLGGVNVLPTVRHQITLISRLRRHARGELRDRLLGTEARWAEFAGWLCDDLGQQAAGASWIAKAVDMAEEAGDREFCAYLLARRAQRAAASGDEDRILGLARAAEQIRQAPPLVRAFVALQQAHGHASSGEQYEFQRAAQEARDLAAKTHATDSSLGAFCTQPYIAAQEAEGWLRSGNPHRAITCFEQAISDWPVSYRRERGMCLARAASAHLAAGEPDQAAVVASEALILAESTLSTRIVREVATLRVKIAPFKGRPAVKVLLDRLTPAGPGA